MNAFPIYSSSRQQVEMPITPEDTLKAESGDGGSKAITAVFDCISAFEIGYVLGICERKLSGNEGDDVIRTSLFVPDKFTWIFDLSNEDLASSHVLLTQLIVLMPTLLQTLNPEAINKNVDVVVCTLSFNDPHSQNPILYRVWANAGEIFFQRDRDKLSEPVHLAHSKQLLTGLDLRHLNLERVDLHSAQLSRTNFEGATLNDAIFHDANMGGVKLAGATCIHADFSMANLAGADLSGADLTGAKFFGTGFDFLTNLQNAIFNFTFPSWNANTLNDYFANQENGNLLTMINGIQDADTNREGVPQKVDIVRQMIKSLGSTQLPENIKKALTNFFNNNDLFRSYPDILDYFFLQCKM